MTRSRLNVLSANSSKITWASLSSARLFFKRQLWIWPLLAAVMLGVVGYFVKRAVDQSLKENLASQLQVVLNADVAALQEWFQTQEKLAQAAARDNDVIAATTALIEFAKTESSPLALVQSKQRAEVQEALAPWIEHRQAQGHQIAMLSNLGSPGEIREQVYELASGGKLKYLVIVGDADPRMYRDRQVRGRCVPVHYSRAIVNVKFGSSPEIATDNWYADLDDDRVPDLAVGRLACDSPEEVQLVVSKILAYERSRDFGAWRRQVHFVAGLGGFGAVADTVMEAAAKSLINNGVPSAFCTTMTYGSWQSPYCPDPRDFRRVTLERLNEGSLFWVYLGHGQQRSVDEVHVPGGRFPILSADDASELASRHGATIACFLACYSGAYDLPQDCLGEELLRTEGGPVAILCGSRVTMPYAMTVMGSELLSQVFTHQAPTLGDALLGAKRRMMETENLGAHRMAMDALARLLSPTADELVAERADQPHQHRRAV